ncbi:MAG: LysR family transcriptional regulator [Leptolyngbya sp. Prado105]|jgi:DNA-binding transcriptional LysR family regulator|nr:LysR family transcriptional regulator [Leptolyngbya sp. Prado105]
MVNLEWYRSFIQVYRVGTVSGAAQVLHLTQPAVSQHIAALEAALGQPLFQRLPRRMSPTDEGKRLYTQTAAAIEQLESITTQILPTDAPQVIRIGTPQEFFTQRILSRLPQAENLLYRVRLGLAQDLIEQLLKEQLDVVVATQKITRSELEYQLVHKENFWLVAPPETIVPIPPEVLQVDLTSLEQWLRRQPLIAYSEELPIVRRFWRVVFGRRLDVAPRLVLPDLQMIRQAITAGFGFSVLPDYLCDEMVDSKLLTLILKPTDAVSNQILLAYRRSERQSQRIQLLLDLLTAT